MTVSRGKQENFTCRESLFGENHKGCAKRKTRSLYWSVSPLHPITAWLPIRRCRRMRKNQGIPYTDLNLFLKELKIDWQKDSLDGGDHLNLSGAGKVTSWLGNYLKETFSLPDHRGEERYAAWENMAKKYEKRAKEILENM